MSIEQTVIDYLSAQLGAGTTGAIPVSGSVPHPMPDVFVTVEKTGGSVTDLIPEAQLHIKSWSTTRASAEALNELVTAAMLAAVSQDAISSCALTASYNNPDLETHKPRYSASFAVTYLE